MSRWYRAYAGMARDDKLVRAAIKCGQPIERVVWVWAAILESAAEINDDGCGARGVRLECDHVHPVSKGGRSEDDNLTTACLPCNRSKRDKLLSEWRA